MTDALKTEGLYLTLPTTWLELIDQKLTGLKTRQDVIREASLPFFLPIPILP